MLISEEGYIEVTSQVKKNNVIIEFRDNGVGMNREVIKEPLNLSSLQRVRKVQDWD